jgi:hypothetical protein
LTLILCAQNQQRRTFPTFPNLCEQVEWLNQADPGSKGATFPPFRSRPDSCVWRASRNFKPPFQTFPNLFAQVKRLNRDV